MMKRFIGVLSVSIFAAAILASPASAAPAVRQTADVNEFGGALVSENGASLVRTNSGVSMHVSTTVGGELFDLFAGPLGVDWQVGDATTNWFVVFNEPGECTDGVCGEDDVQDAATGANNDPKVGVLFATGHVAGGRAGRRPLHFEKVTPAIFSSVSRRSTR